MSQSKQRVFKRGLSPSFLFLPLPLIKGKGDTGGWGSLEKTRK